jgi:hypothetical protein
LPYGSLELILISEVCIQVIMRAEEGRGISAIALPRHDFPYLGRRITPIESL